MPTTPQTQALRHISPNWFGLAVSIVIGLFLSPIILHKLAHDARGLLPGLPTYLSLNLTHVAANPLRAALIVAAADLGGRLMTVALITLVARLLGSGICFLRVPRLIPVAFSKQYIARASSAPSST